jgi:hypothetical protein
MKTVHAVLLATSLLLGSAGCAGPTFVVQQYAGPARPAASVAILRFEGDGPVQMVALDGERADVLLDDEVRLHVEMLPGAHRLLAVDLAEPDRPARGVTFRAQAGRLYRAVFTGGALRVFEIDDSTGALGADATVEPAPGPE